MVVLILISACGNRTVSVKRPLCVSDLIFSPKRIWRLAHNQYDNSIRDLLGDNSAYAKGFLKQGEFSGLINPSDQSLVGEVLAEDYFTASEKIAEGAVTKLSSWMSCSPPNPNDENCVNRFIKSFGKRVYRRPLTQAQVDTYMGVYRNGKQTSGLDGLKDVIRVFFNSPYFLYRLELGDPSSVGAFKRLSSYEMATQLSFLFWNTTPDMTLMGLADDGKLGDPDIIKTQVARLLGSPNAQDFFWNFFYQLLDLAELSHVSKDGSKFPDFNPELRALLLEETRSFVQYIIDKRGASFKELLLADYSFLNDSLGRFYSVPNLTGSELKKTNYPAGQRKGILTHGALLAVKAGLVQGSPVHRGLLVRRGLMCGEIPEPPADVDNTPPEENPIVVNTNRDRYSQHTSESRCVVCHQYMDPIGFGFESFDGVGKFRTTDNGFMVNSAGEIKNLDYQASVPFEGVIPLITALSNSEQVSRCMVKKIFQFALGRAALADEQCTVDEIHETFAGANHSLVELVKGLTNAAVFQYRQR